MGGWDVLTEAAKGTADRGTAGRRRNLTAPSTFEQASEVLAQFTADVDDAYRTGSTLQDNLSWALAGIFAGLDASVDLSKEDKIVLAQTYVSLFPSPYALSNVPPYLKGFTRGLRESAEGLGQIAAKMYLDISSKGLSAALAEQVLKVDSLAREASTVLKDPNNQKLFFSLGFQIGMSQGAKIKKALSQGKDAVVEQMGALVGTEVIAEILSAGLLRALKLAHRAVSSVPQFRRRLDELASSGKPDGAERGLSTEVGDADALEASGVVEPHPAAALLDDSGEGFSDPELQEMYEVYRKRAKKPVSPLQWTERTTQGPLARLKELLGEDFRPTSAKGTNQERRRISDYAVPEGYTKRKLTAAIRLLLSHADELFDRVERSIPAEGIDALPRLLNDPVSPTFTKSEFNILKGNVAEILSLSRQMAELAELRKMPGNERAVLLTKVKVRRVKDGVLQPRKLFSDNVIAVMSPDRTLLRLLKVFEVKSGGFSSSKIQEQVFDWVEDRAEDGLVLVVEPGSKQYARADAVSAFTEQIEFTYFPSAVDTPRLTGLVSADRHLLIPKGENFPLPQGDSIAAKVERGYLSETTEVLDYITARLLGISSRKPETDIVLETGLDDPVRPVDLDAMKARLNALDDADDVVLDFGDRSISDDSRGTVKVRSGGRRVPSTNRR